ncbi:MAG: phage minor capsid protein [Candidatus Paceibacterota bacterium]
MASIEKSTQKITSLYRAAQKEIVRELRDASDFRRTQLESIQIQVDQVLDELETQTELIVNEELRKHYTDGSFKVVSAFQSAGIPIAASLSQFDEEAIKAMFAETFTHFGQGLQAANRDVARIMSIARRERIRTLIAQGTITGNTRREISKQIKAELSNGITALRDRGGRKWSLDDYSEMLARTKMREATNEGVKNKMRQEGADLVQVSNHNSDHDACAAWEGKVLSISGETEGYPTVEEAEAAGLMHPNCEHRYLVYRKGLAEFT